jgi:hypothetical protein
MNLIDPVKPFARRVIGQFRKARDLEIVSFDRLFPDVRKITLFEPKRIETPELEGLPLVPGVAEYGKPFYETPEMFAAVLEDVLFCPVNNVVMSTDFKILAESISTIRELEYIDAHALGVRKITPLKGVYATVRSVHNNYYHSLIDNPPRLFALGLPQLRSYDPIQVLTRGGMTSQERFLWEGLRPSNVRISSVRHRQLFRLEKFVFVSTMTRRHAAYLHEPHLRALRRAVLPRRPRHRNRRIFVSRELATNGRHVRNQDAVWSLLKRHGFEKVLLEKMSLAAQRDLFFEAETVIAAHGAGLANLIFAEQANVIEWFASPHFVPSYYFLSKALDHRYRCVFAGETWRDDDFEIDIDVLEGILDEMLGRPTSSS